ncbi:MAG: GNAT family N-acetyltransferase [Dehalococcoidales bacterium]
MKSSIFELPTVSPENYSNLQSFFKELFVVIRSSQVWYPEILNWYSFKFSPGLNNGSRKIVFFAINNEIAGTALLKNIDQEKKICTFFVKNQYRNNGIGKSLFGKCLEILDTDKPVITVPAERLPQFSRIFKYYDFKLEQVVDNYYRSKSQEYVFNGNLELKITSGYENIILECGQFLQEPVSVLSNLI